MLDGGRQNKLVIIRFWCLLLPRRYQFKMADGVPDGSTAGSLSGVVRLEDLKSTMDALVAKALAGPSGSMGMSYVSPLPSVICAQR